MTRKLIAILLVVVLVVVMAVPVSADVATPPDWYIQYSGYEYNLMYHFIPPTATAQILNYSLAPDVALRVDLRCIDEEGKILTDSSSGSMQAKAVVDGADCFIDYASAKYFINGAEVDSYSYRMPQPPGIDEAPLSPVTG